MNNYYFFCFKNKRKFYQKQFISDPFIPVTLQYFGNVKWVIKTVFTKIELKERIRLNSKKQQGWAKDTIFYMNEIDLKICYQIIEEEYLLHAELFKFDQNIESFYGLSIDELSIEDISKDYKTPPIEY